MDIGELYPPGSRELQDRFESRALADRLQEITVKDRIEERERAFIEGRSFFFLSTVSADGWPDVSYKGGAPGFVRVLDETTLAFPSYDGNGMFRSAGNIADTGRVALLFIDFEKPRRMRVHGTATVRQDEEALSSFPEADLVVEVEIARVFPNCPRYIHDLATGELSDYAPRPGHEPPEPEWKSSDAFADVVPSRDR